LFCGIIIDKTLSLSKPAGQRKKIGKALGIENKIQKSVFLKETFFPFTWLGNYGIDNSDFLMNLDHEFE
jgi:hypothetical protein